MKELYPYSLSYITKSPIWGGTRLAREFGIRSEQSTIGEAWMLTVREAENSMVQNGGLAGKTLAECIDTYGTRLIGTGDYQDGFPLLIKLIDACDRLSVQVHPDDAYAQKIEHSAANARGKTEMWYIVDAEPGAEIVYGLAEGITSQDFEKQVRAGNYEAVLRHQPVHPGETYFIPSGMLHAIGKGILIAEIQQNCDLTYRVWDYDRIGADGKPRELHVEKAIDVTRPFTDSEIAAIRYEACNDESDVSDLLAACRYFRVQRLTAEQLPKTLTVGTDSFVSLLALSGEGELLCDGNRYPISKGSSYYLPAGLGEVQLSGDVTVLLSSL